VSNSYQQQIVSPYSSYLPTERDDDDPPQSKIAVDARLIPDPITQHELYERPDIPLDPRIVRKRKKMLEEHEKIHDAIMHSAKKAFVSKPAVVEDKASAPAEKKKTVVKGAPLVELETLYAGVASKVPHKVRQTVMNKLYTTCREKFKDITEEDMHAGLLKIERSLFEKAHHQEDFKSLGIDFIKKCRSAATFEELIPPDPVVEEVKIETPPEPEKPTKVWIIEQPPPEESEDEETSADQQPSVSKNPEEIDLDAEAPESSNSNKSVTIAQKEVISIAKESLRSVYTKGEISKDQYSLILKKIVSKVVDDRFNSMDKSQALKFIQKQKKKIEALVEQYIEKHKTKKT
jgi:hypothetical protein